MDKLTGHLTQTPRSPSDRGVRSRPDTPSPAEIPGAHVPSLALGCLSPVPHGAVITRLREVKTGHGLWAASGAWGAMPLGLALPLTELWLAQHGMRLLGKPQARSSQGHLQPHL